MKPSRAPRPRDAGELAGDVRVVGGEDEAEGRGEHVELAVLVGQVLDVPDVEPDVEPLAGVGVSRACSIIGAELSIAATSAPPRAARSAIAPVPVPRSSQRSPGCGPRRSTSSS